MSKCYSIWQTIGKTISYLFWGALRLIYILIMLWTIIGILAWTFGILD